MDEDKVPPDLIESHLEDEPHKTVLILTKERHDYKKDRIN